MYQFDGLLDEIKYSDVITIFRHVRPDCDAVGSQFGLKSWLNDNFPEKKVYALGNEYCQQGNCWPVSDECSNETVLASLAIVLDTANEPRIDDERYAGARRVIKIDHHPNRDPYGHRQYVFEESAAACEILGEFFRQCNEQYSLAVSQKTAENLYRGLLTDTLRFCTANTRSHTLEIAGWLSQFSVRIPELNRQLFDQSLRDFRFENFLRDTVTLINDCMAYRILNEEELREWDYTASAARDFVGTYKDVKEFEVFAIITEKTDSDGTKLYEASLRSKTVTINDIAEKFGGGGHKNACGVKDITALQLDNMIMELYERIPAKTPTKIA